MPSHVASGARSPPLTSTARGVAMHEWQAIGYWVWGLGALLLALVFAWA